MSTPVVIPITGSIDPALLAGLVSLATNITAAGRATDEAGKKAQAAKPAWSFEGLGDAATRFNNIRQAIGNFVSDVDAAASHVAALSDEQNQLDASSARIGVNFDDAAAAAGRFADETEAMNAAQQFAARGIRLTQVELNDIMRVAGATAQTLGTAVGPQVERLTEGLVRGRAEGLAPFGATMAATAGEAHTAAERLAVLHVRAGEVGLATDNAASSMARYRDTLEDAERVVATAFVSELGRLNGIASEARTASDGVADLNLKLAATGHVMALAVAAVSGGLGVIVGAVGTALGAVGQAAAFTLRGSGLDVGLNNVSRDLRLASQGMVRDSVNGLEAIGRADRDRTTAAPDPVSAPVASNSGRVDMVFTEAQVTAGNRRSGPTAAQSAQARLTSQAGAREMVASMEHDLVERRIADLDRLTGAEDAASDVAARIADIDHANTMQATADAVQLAEDQRGIAAMEDANLRDRLERQRSFNGELQALFGEQASAAHIAATETHAAFEGVGASVAKNVELFRQGRLSLKETGQAILADSLENISKRMYARGAEFLAEAAGFAVLGDFVHAGGALAASAGFLATGAALGALSADAAPTPRPAGGGGAGGGGGGAGGIARSPSPAPGNDAPTTVVYQIYGPVVGTVGGREATDGDVATQIDRYTDGGRARIQRPRA